MRNDLKRVMPGAVFLFENKRYVSFGVQSNGSRFTNPLLEKGYVSVSKCRLVKQNSGLVFLGATIDELNNSRMKKKEKQNDKADQ